MPHWARTVSDRSLVREAAVAESTPPLEQAEGVALMPSDRAIFWSFAFTPTSVPCFFPYTPLGDGRGGRAGESGYPSGSIVVEATGNRGRQSYPTVLMRSASIVVRSPISHQPPNKLIQPQLE